MNWIRWLQDIQIGYPYCNVFFTSGSIFILHFKIYLAMILFLTDMHVCFIDVWWKYFIYTKYTFDV